MLKIVSTVQLLPNNTIRIRDLASGQLALQTDKAVVWYRAGRCLLFTPLDEPDIGWSHHPTTGSRIYVTAYPPGTEITFKSTE